MRITRCVKNKRCGWMKLTQHLQGTVNGHSERWLEPKFLHPLTSLY